MTNFIHINTYIQYDPAHMTSYTCVTSSVSPPTGVTNLVKDSDYNKLD